MDNFGKRPQQPEKSEPAPEGVPVGHDEALAQPVMPARRPSVVNVPPPEEQLKHVKRPRFSFRRKKAESKQPLRTSSELEVPGEALEQLDLEVKEVRYARRRSGARVAVISSVVAILVAVIGALVWYGVQLLPVNGNNKNLVAIQIPQGYTPDKIASELKKSNVIRNELVFLAQARIQGVQGKLQAGTYRISQSESLFSVLDHLVKGSADTFDITFLPGATVAENKKVLMAAGYDKKEVDEAFAATYDSPLFEGKPKDMDLEGYVYGDTYKFAAGLPAKKVLEKVFAQFYSVISERRLDRGFKLQGLTLYQGITLASIIQRESGGNDEAQIAQIFYLRMKQGMPLGSDVTYQYAADKMGVPRDINLDSPYNTRRFTGLPPGPIATPGYEALKAVSLPAEGDYLYFLSGDDDVTYYGKTLQEHEANIKNHCHKKCQII